MDHSEIYGNGLNKKIYIWKFVKEKFTYRDIT